MSPEIELVITLATLVLYGVMDGTDAAIQLLSHSYSERADKGAQESSSRERFVDRVLDDAIDNHFSIVTARIVFLALLVGFGVRVVPWIHSTTGLGVTRVLIGVFAAFLLVRWASRLIALRFPDGYLYHVRAIVYPFIYLLKPLALLFRVVAGRIFKSSVEKLAFSVLPLKRRIELFGYKNGDDDNRQEQELMSSLIDFGDTKVKEVMIPRIDMVAINMHMETKEALDVIVEAGHSRVPVFDDSIDRVVGVVHTKDLLKQTIEGDEPSLRGVLRDVYFVPETKKIDELLTEFKSKRMHIAIVVDEYGGTAGLITLEDILEELVGEIQDEFDADEELVKRIDDDSVLCNSRVHLDDLNEALGIDLPIGDVDTLGGFLYEMIGRVPRVGEVVPHGKLQFRIQSVMRQRIDKVLIRGLRSAGEGVEGNVG